MAELSIRLFSSDGFMPQGTSLWRPSLLAIHGISDSLIGVAYLALAGTLAWLVYRGGRQLPYRWLLGAFAVFIGACGVTHLLEVYTLWVPAYWLSGGVKVVTAVASLATAFALPRIAPALLSTARAARLTDDQRSELETAVAELRESESRFREAFDHAPIGKGLVSLDGHWLKVNPALCEILGYSEEELLGMTFQQVTHAEDLGADMEHARQLAAGEITSYQMEKRYIRKDGRAIWVLLSGSAVRDADDLPLYFIAQIQDITARRAAQERDRELARAQAAREEAETAAARMEFLARASSVLASSLDYEATLQTVARLTVPALGDFCFLDVVEEDGSITRVAAAHARPEMQALADESKRHPPPRWASAHPVVRALDKGETVLLRELDEAELPADGSPQAELVQRLQPRALLTVPLLAGGRVFGALTTVLDRSSERTFGSVEVALAEEVGRRAGVAVEHARLFRQAQEANRAKSDFLTVMSHELRTPLNAVVGYTDLLQAGVPGPLTDAQADYLDRVRRSAAHLLSLIEEVLSYARLEAGRETVRRDVLELDELVRQSVTLVEPLARERGLSFEVHVPDHVVRLETDARKVRQMLANLLSNAMKFTERGQVTLTASERGDDVCLEVRDTGIGIAPEHLDKIFEPFWQAESGTTRRADGTGLGLGVTRRLARLLGGDVTVQSEVGRGSTLTLRIPKRVKSA